MPLFITSLNSGSNGNCYYVGNDTEAVLVDAGISCRETEIRMARLGLSMQKVKAIFISHEHSDHIRGVPVLAKKYNLPVYVTSTTLRYCHFTLDKGQVFGFKPFKPVNIGGLQVTAFPKKHDASEPHSFVVTGDGINVGVFTDIGAPCQHLTTYFKQCHAAFLEANYDDDMLENGRYPYHLKNRIRGGHGHLSNKQALDFFVANRPTYLSHIILAHLSKDNNCPKQVFDLFNSNANGAEVVVASRFAETPVYTITSSHAAGLTHEVKFKPPRPVQMSLF